VTATVVVGLVYVATAFRTGVPELDALVTSLAPRLGGFGRVLLLWRAALRRRRPRD
jgi:hypothetical protein